MKRPLLFLYCIALIPAADAVAIDLYVKPDGNDAFAGTSLETAFATLARAQSAIRELQPLQNDATVRIAPGAYFLNETLTFTDADSAPEGMRITWRAADRENKPRISGGRRISGTWKDEGDGVFSIATGEGDFHQLFVNGRLAVRAREPDVGKWRQLEQWEPITKTVRLDGSGIMGKWQRINDVEFVVKKHWAISRLNIKWWGTYDGDDVFGPLAPELEFEQAHVPPKAKGQRYFFENAREFLDQPGEWYLNGETRRLFYMPLPGEDLNTAEVIAPRLERVIDLAGTARITCDGLVIAHGNWLNDGDKPGYVGAQANVHWDGWHVNPGAMHLTDTTDVEVLNCVVRNTTAGGILLTRGTRHTLVEGNHLHTIGCTPIAVYTQKDKNPELPKQCCDDVIRNNLVEDYGTRNFAASGICVSVATRCTVEHNEVRRGGYSGITYGYFSNHDSPGAGSAIRANHIHHVMREMDDGAGIYVFSTKFDRSGSTLLVERNFIHDVYRSPDNEPNPTAGVYLDEGAGGVTLRENVIRRVGNTIHLNTGNRGKPNETRRCDQVYDGNTDENAVWECEAGFQPAFAHLSANISKPKPDFEQAKLIHHWPLDGNLVDKVTGASGQLVGGATFSDDASSLSLNGKRQWADLGVIEWPERFTVCFRVRVPDGTTGEKAVFATPGFRVYSGVEIGEFREDLRTTVIDGEHKRDARTEADAFPRGRWNDVVITVDRWHEAQRVYVNGQDATNTDHLGHNTFQSTGKLLLGVFSEDPQHKFRDLRGEIDEFRIYRGLLRIGK